MARLAYPGPNAVAAAAEALRNGDLVGLPTETVYGLAADATNPQAVAKVFAAKRRPRFNPLIAHVADLAMAEAIAVFDEPAQALAAAFWPGPLTLVLPRRSGSDRAVCDLACAGLDTVAVRLPSHPTARQVIAALGRPVAAPSANVSGRPSPTRANHVCEELGDATALVIDGGPCAVGLESTVIAPPREGFAGALLRLGGLDRERLEAVCGPLVRPDVDPKAPRSPGQTLRHYAPRAVLRLNAEHARQGEAFLGFGRTCRFAHLNLSTKGDVVEAAGNLFAYLRALDSAGFPGIAVARIPADGLGEAIQDRLSRAASAHDPIAHP
ncbi:MAG: L-threonylcarbamoyladenylate synthase [Maricaulaceae bacterium]